MRIYVEGIGVRGPGLNGWPETRARLIDPLGYVRTPAQVPLCALLPAAERRRTVGSVNLALAVASEAIESAGRAAEDLPAVFSSSCGDGTTIHEIIEALNAPEHQVSPIRFHNSVHNAPAGYWGIATRSREPSTSLCCFDASFSAGLLEAAVRVSVECRPVILVVYDMPYPEPLASVRPIAAPFGMALLLAPAATDRSVAVLEIDLCADAQEATPMSSAVLEDLRCGNPAARSLPVLAALAQSAPRAVSVDYVAPNRLAVSVGPC